MRIKCIGLEHHGNATIGRISITDRLAANHDIATGNILQPRDHSEKRGFSAAGRADKNDEFPVFHLKVGAMDHLQRTVSLDHVFERKFRHAASPYLTAPAEMPAMK